MRLALTGDSILLRPLNSYTDPAARPLFDLIRASDVAFTNLEVVPNDYEGDPALESGGSHFGAPAHVLDDLAQAGFSLFSAANNHSLDYSISGLRKALGALKARRMCFAGIGENLEEARRPTYLTHPSGTVALLACSSTFGRGQEASEQTRDMPGRPGLNPLRFQTCHTVSPADLATLRDLSDRLGFSLIHREAIKLGFAFPRADRTVFPFLGHDFRAGERTATTTEASERDVEGIVRWIEEARLVSDLVVVSVHNHEFGHDRDGVPDYHTPPQFLRDFARRAIEAGADVIVGHGPHVIRGFELYNGKPIFYSLGNFIGQNELVGRLPSDSYTFFRAPPDMTPARLYRLRTDNDRKSFPAEPMFWESILPICTFRGRTLESIRFHAIDLQLGLPMHRRGTPILATPERGERVLERFAALSRPFGTTFRKDGASLIHDVLPDAAR
ncbi:poly-gamma-glutamate biosynthesis like protein [Gluconacetobacter sacchari DSM 12717]|uniref:CapA family protein n=2 Tax=Gluconacetobacter sacchari TaxID=92759 RepID=A0A7W4ICW8_9PROT|nr:CapA family protein [Gluconacetobacter sacchari]MBB2160555.1 CapA family protein [Gluconacetobacter sacchari]GBQ33044.1 poly-gamma-glutamate biosynthesis like protein [Gluconacetobacter sacchari DSM 12717]